MPTARRNPWIAGLLSILVPGLGQVYNGQAKRGLLFYCLLWVVGLASSAIIQGLSLGFFSMLALSLILFLGILYIFIDAITTARRLGDTYQMKAYNKWYLYLVVFGLAAFVVQPALNHTIREVVIQPYKIPAGSMLPTLAIGDHILVNKMFYGIRNSYSGNYLIRFTKPQHGDLVVFIYPVDRSKDFIKRVIGVEGDQVEIRNKKVYINGQPIEDPHASFQDTSTPSGGVHLRDRYGPRSVPKGHIFVMGDNRDRSYDSRFWGFVPLRDVKGKAFVIYWSWDQDGSVRWERIGMQMSDCRNY